MPDLKEEIKRYIGYVIKWYMMLKSSDVDIETKLLTISNVVANIVNCVIFIFLVILYYLAPHGSGMLMPLFGSSICLFIMVQGYIQKSIFLHSIYLISAAIFYLTLSTYVILYNLVLADVPNHIVYALMFKMNIPTMIMGFAVAMNATDIEKEISVDVEKRSINCDNDKHCECENTDDKETECN